MELPNRINQTTFYSENEKFVSLGYIKFGITRHFMIDKDGKDITKNFTAGESIVFYSVSSFISKQPGYIQFQALTNCEIIHWSDSDFQTYFNQPKWKEFYLHKIEAFGQKKEEKEISLLRDNSTTRYLNFVDSKGELLNLIPHHYIASYLGMKPETLSRIRAKIY